MTPGIYDFVPGVREASKDYLETQLEAFLDIEPSLCGVDVMPFTPQMYIELMFAKNRCFVGDGYPGAAEIVQFLWRISTKFERDNPEKKSLFTKCISHLIFEDIYPAIVDYTNRSWSGMPAWDGTQKRVSMGVWPSRIVHTIANEYSWSEKEILNLPFRRLWQYINRIMEKYNPDYNQRSPEAVHLSNEYLKKLNAPHGR